MTFAVYDNLKIGDYIRTKDGYIAKYISNKGNNSEFIFDSVVLHTIDDGDYSGLYRDELDNILEISENIIDLIKVGDYVNGLKVDEIDEKGIYNYNSYDGWRINIASCNEDIKSIVTSEQFKSMEYGVK